MKDRPKTPLEIMNKHAKELVAKGIEVNIREYPAKRSGDGMIAEMYIAGDHILTAVYNTNEIGAAFVICRLSDNGALTRIMKDTEEFDGYLFRELNKYIPEAT